MYIYKCIYEREMDTLNINNFQFYSKIAKIIINLLQSQICKYDINITVITWFKHLHNFIKSRYQFNLYIYVYQPVYHEQF